MATPPCWAEENGGPSLSGSYDPETLYSRMLASSHRRNRFLTSDSHKPHFSDERTQTFNDSFSVTVVPVRHESNSPPFDGLLAKYNLEPHVSLIKIEKRQKSNFDSVAEKPDVTTERSDGTMTTESENKDPKQLRSLPEDDTRQQDQTTQASIVTQASSEGTSTTRTLKSVRSKHQRKFGRLASLNPARRKAILEKRKKLKERRQQNSSNQVRLV